MKTFNKYAFPLLLIVALCGCKPDKVEPNAFVITDVKTQKDQLKSYGLMYNANFPDFYCTSIIASQESNPNPDFTLSAPFQYSKNYELKLGEFVLTSAGDDIFLNINGFPNDRSAHDHELKKKAFMSSVYGKNLPLTLTIGNRQMVNDVIYFNEILTLKPFPKTDLVRFYNKSAIYRKKCTAQYNRDPKNKDGILAIVLWLGESIHDTFNGRTYQLEKPLFRYVYFSQDNGELVFPNKTFDDIPTGALIYLEFHRSTIKKYEREGKVFLFKFQSSQQVNGILLDE